MTKRYYVTNSDFIPFHEQPENGYTELQAVERAQREVEECVRLFGGSESDYISWFHIIDNTMHYCRELDNAI